MSAYTCNTHQFEEKTRVFPTNDLEGQGRSLSASTACQPVLNVRTHRDKETMGVMKARLGLASCLDAVALFANRFLFDRNIEKVTFAAIYRSSFTNANRIAYG